MSIDTTKKIKQVTYNGTEIPLRGYDTSDATVTAGDVVSPKVAYGASGKVNGTMANYRSGVFTLDNTRLSVRGRNLNIKGDPPRAMAIDMNTTVQASTALSNFGNATAADVAKGKTFTSAAGLKVVGTAAVSSGIETVSFRLSNRYSSELWVSFPVVNSSAEENDSVTVTRGTISVGQTVEIEAPANAMITVLGTDRTASDTLTVDKAIPTVNYNGGLTLMSFVALATLEGQTVSISY